MKKAFFFLLFFFGFLLNIQAQSIFGYYINEEKYEDGIHIKYELTLNEDYSFKFRFYQDQICYEEEDKVVGTWKVKGAVVLLTPKKDINIETANGLNLKNTKLKVIENSKLQVFGSVTTWLNDLILKKEKN